MRSHQLAKLIIVLILSFTPTIFTDDNWCPSDCTCSVITGQTLQNHAKCTSLHGVLESKNLPIHSLDLSNASLTKVSHLEKLRVLRTANFSNNKLSDLGTLGLRVRSLDLSHNKITSAKLVNIPRYIEELDLSFNEITYLPLELTKINLRRLELYGNKLNCTCDTLEVRNWLAKHSVFTSHPVICTYPLELKGMLWMQIKQDQYCKTNNDETNTDKYLLKKIEDDDDNDLMLGDQPIYDDEANEHKGNDGNDELGKDFIPINKQTDQVVDENVEGSGATHLQMQNENEDEHHENSKNDYDTNEPEKNDEENEEVEGSGGGVDLSTSTTEHSAELENNTTASSETDDVTFVETEVNESSESTPIPIPPADDKESEENSTLPGLGIFGVGINTNEETSPKPEETTTEEEEVEKEEVAVVQTGAESENNNEDEDKNKETEIVDTGSTNETDAKKDDMVIESDIEKAEAGENNGTYILVGTVLIILVCLLMYVGLKKMIAKRKRNERDAERASELVDMDKKNLGKPLPKGTNSEQKPLISNEKPASNGDMKKDYPGANDEKIQEPLLNGHHKEPADNESNNNLSRPQEEKIPIPEPRQSLQNQQSPQSPKEQQQQQQQPQSVSPRLHSPRFGSYPPPRSPRSGDETDGSSPSSPKAGRYSPVYSPETGKVKIKLSEVPKPKTPLLVTKGRSNTGDIVTTIPTVTPVSDEVDIGRTGQNETK